MASSAFAMIHWRFIGPLSPQPRLPQLIPPKEDGACNGHFRKPTQLACTYFHLPDLWLGLSGLEAPIWCQEQGSTPTHKSTDTAQTCLEYPPGPPKTNDKRKAHRSGWAEIELLSFRYGPNPKSESPRREIR